MRGTLPVKRQIVTRCHLDGVGGLDVAQDIASHINRCQVLDWRIIVATSVRGPIVRWCAYSFAGPLVYAVHEDALETTLVRTKCPTQTSYPYVGMSIRMPLEERQQQKLGRMHHGWPRNVVNWDTKNKVGTEAWKKDSMSLRSADIVYCVAIYSYTLILETQT
jgi:hypothetical protein